MKEIQHTSDFDLEKLTHDLHHCHTEKTNLFTVFHSRITQYKLILDMQFLKVQKAERDQLIAAFYAEVFLTIICMMNNNMNEDITRHAFDDVNHKRSLSFSNVFHLNF